jgi:hypothetical protein
MANTELITSTQSDSPWYSIFINTLGFLVGFMVGGVTGYFGNWLWYRFGPNRKNPHFTMTTQDGSTSFSGVMTEENQRKILNSLKAVTTPKPKSVITLVTDVSDKESDIT